MDVFIWLILGLIAGFFAHQLFPAKYKVKIILDIVAGGFGAAFGRILAGPITAQNFSLQKLIIPIAFAGLLILLARTLRI